MMIALVVHGGCGIWLPYAEEAAVSGCRDALEKGYGILQAGGSALDVVVAACVSLEDNPIFNAGTGSVLNINGDAQMDASVMEGHTLRFGAIAAIERVRNPILVAQKVSEVTDHTILAGAGAVDFARQMGFPDYDPRTPQRIAEHAALQAKVPDGTLKVNQFSVGHPEHAHSATAGTVGAVALDSYGNLATATTTGGRLLKLPGRVGDTLSS
ncbi:MAG: isoaspartyl peptidase/L-asparaginase [Leptolyngbya sp. SIO1D8]|nr:isoaspartyl peptidase/L-asparaginase [Leptolyngbya sp. SIO1D8]